MGYMTMQEQIESHLSFLRQESFIIDTLQIDRGFIRCCSIMEPTGRGELCYQTKKTFMKNGLIGLATWLRGMGGHVKTHMTYGLARSISMEMEKNPTEITEAVKKAEIFWQMSNETGEAEYLLHKGVGYYGIRFRSTDFGKVAVVPMRTISGELRSYQLINADGTKRFAKNCEIKKLHHTLHKPINGHPIGLAESYVTASTCLELIGMAMVVAFTADNLKHVALALRERYSSSHIIIYGDNDRHLPENKGKLAAEAAQKSLGGGCDVVIPEFAEQPKRAEFSDWNDYVREYGIRKAREEVKKILHKE